MDRRHNWLLTQLSFPIFWSTGFSEEKLFALEQKRARIVRDGAAQVLAAAAAAAAAARGASKRIHLIAVSAYRDTYIRTFAKQTAAAAAKAKAWPRRSRGTFWARFAAAAVATRYGHTVQWVCTVCESCMTTTKWLCRMYTETHTPL